MKIGDKVMNEKNILDKISVWVYNNDWICYVIVGAIGFFFTSAVLNKQHNNDMECAYRVYKRQHTESELTKEEFAACIRIGVNPVKTETK